MVIWFTGMSGSGKSTLSKKLITYLNVNNEKVLCLDGDEIREKVDYKNDFSIESIKQNNINIIQLCKNNINSYKYIVVSVIAPLEETRVFARKVLGENYIEIFIIGCIIDWIFFLVDLFDNVLILIYFLILL